MPMHVGDLDGTTFDQNRNFWRAIVTISIHDAGHNPVAGAAVSGSWSSGYSGIATCTTASDGQCSITSGNLRSTSSAVTFDVTNVTGTGWTYISGANHDPDGDSNGTTITVSKDAGALAMSSPYETALSSGAAPDSRSIDLSWPMQTLVRLIESGFNRLLGSLLSVSLGPVRP